MSSDKEHKVIDDIGEYIADVTDSSVDELRENKIEWYAEQAEIINRKSFQNWISITQSNKNLHAKEWITNYLIEAEGEGYEIGDSDKIEFDDSRYKVVVVNKSSEEIILEVVSEVEDKEYRLIDRLCGYIDEVVNNI